MHLTFQNPYGRDAALIVDHLGWRVYRRLTKRLCFGIFGATILMEGLMGTPDFPEILIGVLLLAGLVWAIYNWTHPVKGSRQ
jgi:hypothetical protein